MNASFVLTGAGTILGMVLLRTVWLKRRLTTVALVLWIAAVRDNRSFLPAVVAATPSSAG